MAEEVVGLACTSTVKRRDLTLEEGEGEVIERGDDAMAAVRGGRGGGSAFCRLMVRTVDEEETTAR